MGVAQWSRRMTSVCARRYRRGLAEALPLEKNVFLGHSSWFDYLKFLVFQPHFFPNLIHLMEFSVFLINVDRSRFTEISNTLNYL